MAASHICPFYGTHRGCRKGRKCALLHVTHDGSLARNKAAPGDDAEIRDAFRIRMTTMLQQRLEASQSGTRVVSASYTRDETRPLAVRFVVENTAVSEGTIRAIAGEVREVGLSGKGQLLAANNSPATTVGGTPVFFHGTSLAAGLQILAEGPAAESGDPIGFYTCLTAHEVRYYERGCLIEVLSDCKVCSLQD